MAAKNAKPANSPDEWTFIDSYDGTIETRKDSVTYRKPTYSEILKGVTEGELAELESEPEFEVLASFQFRSKGESFGVGSSAPRKPGSTILSEATPKTEAQDDKSEGCSSDDGIMIISGHYEPEKPVLNKKNGNDNSLGTDSDGCDGNDDDDLTMPNTRTKCGNDSSDDAIAIVDEGCVYDDALFDDDDEMIDLGDSIYDDKSRRDDDDDVDDDVGQSPKISEVLNTSFMDTSLNKIFFDDETEESTEVDPQDTPFMDTSLSRIFIDNEAEATEETEETVKSDVKAVIATGDGKRLLSIDPIDAHKDLAWDSLTFELMNAQPIVMVSTTSLGDNDESDCDLSSDNSFVPISKSDTLDDTSSFDNLSDLSDDDCDFDETPMIPEWFHDPNFKIIGLDDSHNDNICKGFDNDDKEVSNPLVPTWIYDPKHNIYDFDKSFDESDYSAYSDSDSEYISESDGDDDDDNSIVTIPDWLFGSKDKRHHKDDEDSFLFSQLFVDVPTFVILLFLTTALGFSIGHGVTVYLSTQARDTKLDGSPTYPSLQEQRILTAEEIAKIDLLKLEDEIYRQKESELLSSHLRYDLRNVHQKLQQKHHRLVRNYKSTEGQLHVTKSMSWFWRSKFDQEKRRNENSSAVIYLQQQLERVGTMYEKERKVANKWRRMRKSRFPLSRRQNDSSDLITRDNSSKGKAYDSKASLASKYWVQAILSSRGIDWEDFRKRWTKDFKKLKDGCCALNKSFISRELFGLHRNKKSCKKSQDLGSQNATIKRNSKILSRLEEKRSKIKNENEKDVQTRPHPPNALFPAGPPKMINGQHLMFGPIEIKRKGKKGETARRRREHIRKDRLKKREARLKAMEVERQIRELKSVLAELRSERRKAEKEKFQLEVSWRKLKRQRKEFEKEKLKRTKREKKKLKNVKSKLKKARTTLKTWKNVAFLFQKKAAIVQRDNQQISRAKERTQDIKKIKRDLKIEKRKLRKQRLDLKALKTRLRQEHRNYAREGWKLERKRKQLEKLQAPQDYFGKSTKKCSKQMKNKRKETRSRLRKTRKKTQTSSKRKKNRRNKKERWKERWKEKQKTYWEKLEKTLKEWTQNLNKTVKEKAGEKIKKVWKNLQEKIGNLMDFGWTKRKKTKPPYQEQKPKKNKEENSKSTASLIYQKVLAEQLKFEKQKRKELDESRKRMKSKSPMIDKKMKKQRKKNPDGAVKQRQRRQRMKFQREFERLQQWALQMNEKKLEHERIYKDKDKTKINCAKVRLKSKTDENEKDEFQENVRSRREVDSESVDDSSNLTNTLMLLGQPQFSDYQYDSPVKQYLDSKEALESTERIIHDVTNAQVQHDVNKRQSNTGLSIPLDDESFLLSTKNMHPEHHIPYEEHKEQMSNKPTPPLPDPSLYDKLPLLGILESEKGGSMALPIPPPTLDPIRSQGSVEGQSDSGKAWYMSKTPQAWIPPPGPLRSDDSWFLRRSADRAEQRLFRGPSNKDDETAQNPFESEQFEKKDDNWAFQRASDRAKQRLVHGPQNGADNTNEQNSFRTQFLNSDKRFVKKNGIWVFARASNRAEQRLLYEPLNEQSAKDKPSSHSKKTHFKRQRQKSRDKEGTWDFERANDRAEQRLNQDPWYKRRAEGRENDRELEKDSWFVERAIDRELRREEDADDGDNYDDDDDYYIDYGNYDDLDDDISAP